MTTKPTPDRISFSLGTKVSSDGQSRDVHCSYSTDVRDGETPEQAHRRAAAQVESWIALQARLFEQELAARGARVPFASTAAPRPPAPNEMFDPTNGAHRAAAEAVFDELRFGDKRRETYLRKILPGQPVTHLAEIIRDEAAAFNSGSGPRQRSYAGYGRRS